MKYPAARTCEAVEKLSGVSFPDPFRRLEEESPETMSWQSAQNQLAKDYFADWPHRARLRRLVERFHVDIHWWGPKLPRFAGGRWFRVETSEEGHARAVAADQVFGQGRILFDTLGWDDADHGATISWISPSPDGLSLAIGLCADTTEANTIRIIDVRTGHQLPLPPPQVLMDNEPAWLPDSSGFMFIGLAGSAVDREQRAYLHLRLPTPSTVEMDIGWTTARDWRWFVVSRDERHAIAFERCQNPIPVAIARLGNGMPRWRPFVTGTTASLAGHLIGQRYLAVTDHDASRGRVVAIPLEGKAPNDPEHWVELSPETDAVLRTITPVGDYLYLSEFVDSYSRVRIVDADGREQGIVPLPMRGVLGGEWWSPWVSTCPRGHPDRFLFTISTLVASSALYEHRPGEATSTLLKPAAAALPGATVEDRWAVSADGTRVPYHVVRGAEVDPHACNPTLIQGYGGFNAAWVPQFPGAVAAFVAAGGVFVHAHLRGGGEFGLEWWQGGRLSNKQNSYDDLYAIAEDLIASGSASPAELAVTGSSNGGILAAVALTQRPDLWAAVVPREPRTDLIGGCREPYCLMSTLMDRANVSDPGEVRRLAKMSPYHLVRDRVRYPAVYLQAGAHDPRCTPWHARKLAARLQHATAGHAPILLHVWENAGHGGATDRDTALDQYTEWLAFILRNLHVRGWT